MVPGGVDLTGSGTLAGTSYMDELFANAYGTRLEGGGGNDVLGAVVDGSVFDLVLAGGAGNDVLNGSYGGDVYHYARGDGHDLVHDDVRVMGASVSSFFAANPETASYQDRLVFGAGIAAADVQGERVGDDLVLHVGGDEGSITVDGWYDGTMFNKIESFVFADGTTWLAVDVDRMLGESTVGLTVSGGGTLAGSQYEDTLIATDYGARLEGGASNDVLRANRNGSIFDLTFTGGRGDDFMKGSYARDVYHYALGDGHDVILDDVRSLSPIVADFFHANRDTATYQDKLVFGAGIAASDVRAVRQGDDLLLRIQGDAGSITVDGWYDGTLFNKIESLVFADGTTWKASDVDLMAFESPGVTMGGWGSLLGTEWNDVLTATAHATHLIGGAGVDVLQAEVQGGIFGVIFEGGLGMDILRGSYAGDVYRYGLGDGRDFILDDVRSLNQGVADYFLHNPDAESYQDVLVFGPGIAASDVQAERSLDHSLVLRINGSSQDVVTIEDWFDGTNFNKIERFVFDDGTVWLDSDLDRQLSVVAPGLELYGAGTLVGSEHGDYITGLAYGTRMEGGGGDDALSAKIDAAVFDLTFVGGAGNDALQGSYARDFYHFARGDGHDTIYDDVRMLNYEVAYYFQANPTLETYQDHLILGPGITAADVTRTRVEDDLVLDLGGGDSVTVSNWFDGSLMARIELIGFADGTTWTAAMAEQGL